MPADDITWAIQARAENFTAYEICDDYYGGNHNLTFATEKFRNTFGPIFQKLKDNVCPAVVEAQADRIFITAWEGADAKAATELWRASHLDRTHRAAVKNSVKQGDGYIIVTEANNDQGVAFWNFDPSVVGVQYDDGDDPTQIVKAYRCWQRRDKSWRLNLYYADGCEMYSTPPKTTDPPEQPRNWTKTGDEAYDYGRPPVFHFAHDAEPGEMGTSILKDVIPLQDALNKSLCDMMVAGEFISFPQRWATGLEVEIDDETGKPRNPPFTPGVDRMFTGGENVKFGEFQASDPRNFLEVQKSLREEICRVTGTPLHLLYLETNLPSGETLRTAEGRLVKKVEDQEDAYGPEFASMMQVGLKIASKSKKADVRPIWGPSSPHNPLLDAETELVLQQVGISKRRSLKNLGYTDDEITQMFEEAKQELKAAMIAVAPPGGPNAFNRNGSPGQPSRVAPQQQQQKLPVAAALALDRKL